MRVLVVYESMYGNTHKIAESIASGFSSTSDKEVVTAVEARHHDSTQYDLVVVGGPTHAHGLSRRASRESAVERAAKGRQPGG
jgi:menaquinone-dependent protoporphyrinogen IX oxidase